MHASLSDANDQLKMLDDESGGARLSASLRLKRARASALHAKTDALSRVTVQAL